MADYQVIVGNVGCVHHGPSEDVARSIYNNYIMLSKDGVGRVANEEVTLMCDGDIELEYIPEERHGDME